MTPLQLVSAAMVVLACSLVLVLVVSVVAAMRRAGGWGVFAGWSGLACMAITVAAQWREMPPSIAALLLSMALMVWRWRKRIVWAVEHNEAPW